MTRRLRKGDVVAYCSHAGPARGSYRASLVCRVNGNATLDLMVGGWEAWHWPAFSVPMGEGPGTWCFPH